MIWRLAGGIRIALKCSAAIQFKSARSSPSLLLFTNRNLVKNYSYNYILGKEVGQEEGFYKLKIPELLDSVLDGYSATIFAYGQTGSGKTYT